MLCGDSVFSRSQSVAFFASGFLAQVLGIYGAGHRLSWRRSVFLWGTCAANLSSVASGGASPQPFFGPAPSKNGPAPKRKGTCAKKEGGLRQARMDLRQKGWRLEPGRLGTCIAPYRPCNRLGLPAKKIERLQAFDFQLLDFVGVVLAGHKDRDDECLAAGLEVA